MFEKNKNSHAKALTTIKRSEYKQIIEQTSTTKNIGQEIWKCERGLDSLPAYTRFPLTRKGDVMESLEVCPWSRVINPSPAND